MQPLYQIKPKRYNEADMPAKKNQKKAKQPEPDFFSWKPEVAPEVAQEITAIALSAFAVLLILAIFGVGGALPHELLHGLRLAFGFGALLIPVILTVLAWMLFQPSKYQVKANNYIGFAVFLLSLAGLLHLTVTVDAALDAAQNGNGGGFIGYGITKLALMVLNVPAATIVLSTILIISLIVAANTRLSELWRKLVGLVRGRSDEELQVNEASGMVINTRLPIRGTLGAAGKKAPAKEEDALTLTADPDWTPPKLEFLTEAASKPDAGNIKEKASIIESTLSSFGIEVTMGEVNVGPTVTQYTLRPESGVKLNKITGLEHNLALALAAPAIRVEAPIPGKGAVGIEVPNRSISSVYMRSLLAGPEFSSSKSPLSFILGRDVAGAPAVANLAEMPHLLIAGATGSGKSIMINAFLTSLLYRNSPAQLKLILVDPKRVELNLYNDVPHLLAPVVHEPEKTLSALKWAVAEMERRLKLFSEVGKRNIIEYNSSNKDESMPYIVIVIDEMADLMMIAHQDMEGLIVRLAQLARAAGIHLVLATQRPSVNVITGLIKANVPARIAFRVASQVDSRTILDIGGAEKLLGKGDMLFASADSPKPRRIQGAFITEKEIKAVTDYLREQREPQYNEDVLAQQVKLGGGGRSGGLGDMDDVDDDLFEDAADTVIRSGKASASLLQRRLRVGYARAARLLDLLEERGVVGPADGARPRDVLVSSLAEVTGGEEAAESEAAEEYTE